jgi:hypothetical protein
MHADQKKPAWAGIFLGLAISIGLSTRQPELKRFGFFDPR